MLGLYSCVSGVGSHEEGLVDQGYVRVHKLEAKILANQTIKKLRIILVIFQDNTIHCSKLINQIQNNDHDRVAYRYSHSLKISKNNKMPYRILAFSV